MAVCLTFDDGPDPLWTPPILDALDAAGVRATFFVVGRRVAQHPELVQAMQGRGHSIQPHCWSHDRTHHDMTHSEIEEDLRRTLAALRAARIGRPRFWRPAGGAIKLPDTHEVAAAHGLRLTLWHVDPEDWRPEHTCPLMLAHLRSEGVWRAGGNSIVLLHDGRINTPRKTAENTQAVVEPLVDYVRDRGWRLGLIKAPSVASRLRRAILGAGTI